MIIMVFTLIWFQQTWPLHGNIELALTETTCWFSFLYEEQIWRTPFLFLFVQDSFLILNQTEIANSLEWMKQRVLSSLAAGTIPCTIPSQGAALCGGDWPLFFTLCIKVQLLSIDRCCSVYLDMISRTWNVSYLSCSFVPGHDLSFDLINIILLCSSRCAVVG